VFLETCRSWVRGGVCDGTGQNWPVPQPERPRSVRGWPANGLRRSCLKGD